LISFGEENIQIYSGSLVCFDATALVVS